MRYGLIATLLLFAGCHAPHCQAPDRTSTSIIGVWEMTEVRIALMSRCPPLAITNKKEVYTANGLHYEISAESTQVSGTKPSRYSYNNGIVTIFDNNGQKPFQSKAHFVASGVMELDTPDGDVLVFNKVSDDPGRIPAVQKRDVPLKRK